MATNPNNDTGRQSLNRALVENSGMFQDAALQMAQGATATQAAVGALKNAALDKLLGPTALFAGGLVGALMTLRKIVRESQILEKGLVRIAKLQQIQGKFETLLKSAELAKKRIEELYKFTANSPFRFDQVAEANRVLQALTKGAFAGADAMKLVGDAAAASGQNIDDVAERVGKLYNALASGRSLDKIIFQLQLSGLATEELIGKFEQLEAQGASFSEKWSEVEKVLKRTEGGMKNEMQTLDALNTKLDEARAMMAQAFGSNFVEAESRAIATLTEATKNLTPVVARVGADFAAVSTIFREAKTTIIDKTLAVHGMSNALLALWEAAKIVSVAIGGTMLASLAKTIGPLTAAGRATLAAAAANLALSKSEGTLAAAMASKTATLAAVNAGQLKLAAVTALTTAKLFVQAGAAAVHAGAMRAVGTATGFVAARNYVLGASLTVAGGAFRLATVAVKGFLTQLKIATVALLTNPFFLAIAAVTGLASAFFALRRASKNATEGLQQANKASDELNKSLKEQFDAASNTDKWADAMARLSSEINKADQASREFNQSLKERSVLEKLIDFASDASLKKVSTKIALDRQVEKLRKDRIREARNVGSLDVGSQGSELYAASLRQARTLDDQAFSTAASNSDPARQAELFAERRAKLEAEAAAGRSARDRIVNMETDGAYQERVAVMDDARQQTQSKLSDVAATGLLNPDGSMVGVEDLSARAKDLIGPAAGGDAKAKEQLDMVRNAQKAARHEAQKKAELRNAREQSSDELTRLLVEEEDALAMPTATEAERNLRNAELKRIRQRKQQIQELVSNADRAEQEAKQLGEDERKARNQASTNAVALGADQKIVAAVRSGDQSAVEEAKFQREVAMLDEQIRQAREEGRDALAEQLKIQKEQLQVEREASRLRFAADRNVDRMANDALIRGDKAGAQAIRDAAELEAKIQEYRANGLTEEQARKDFSRGIIADAANRGPSVVATGIQKVGGGGGYAASDPMAKAMERTAKASEAHTRLLEQIRDGLKQPPPPPDPYTS